MPGEFICTEGDLEVVILLEAHSLLADIIGPDYYEIGGTAPEQSVQFKNDIAFDAFLVRLNELVSTPTKPVAISGRNVSVSLLDGLDRICLNRADETAVSGLSDALKELRAWLGAVDRIRAYCSAADVYLHLDVSHEQLIAITANAMKHHVLRLSQQLEKVGRWCKAAGYTFPPSMLVAVHNDLILNTRPALQYYATRMIELLGKLFYALNRVVVDRFLVNPTNHVSNMQMPVGVSSEIIKDLYGELLIFHRYDDERITKFTPTTCWAFSNPYWRWFD